MLKINIRSLIVTSTGVDPVAVLTELKAGNDVAVGGYYHHNVYYNQLLVKSLQ